VCIQSRLELENSFFRTGKEKSRKKNEMEMTLRIHLDETKTTFWKQHKSLSLSVKKKTTTSSLEANESNRMESYIHDALTVDGIKSRNGR
jgi:hypothetical protein